MPRRDVIHVFHVHHSWVDRDVGKAGVSVYLFRFFILLAYIYSWRYSDKRKHSSTFLMDFANFVAFFTEVTPGTIHIDPG